MTEKHIDEQAIAIIRGLSIDTVEKAKSGHPGLPLGTAPMAYTLWDKVMKHNPTNPNWINRDRFILSAGHGSALLYSMLHLTGYDLPLAELKAFRQIGSKTPGHPEYGHTVGIEATTGPLGHGFAMGVGMAMAESILAKTYNTDEFKVINHYTYAIVSDGDLMEGVSSEAASLAATLKLGKLIYLYDDNKITIEGTTDIAFTENVGERFNAYGWHVQHVDSSEDLAAIEAAVAKAQAVTDQPSLIIVKTHIGYGSPRQDSPSAHGEPLGTDNVAKTKQALGLDAANEFYVSETVKAHFAAQLVKHQEQEANWQVVFDQYVDKCPQLAADLLARVSGESAIPDMAELTELFAEGKDAATRDASGALLQLLSARISSLIGGSADLGPSNKTVIKNGGSYSADNRLGKNIHFGVREHATGALVNGLALYGGFIPYGATFLVFADFMRPAIRLAALMGIHAVFVLTHDSIAVGEDGPTHQPVEHVMSLRIIPKLDVLRPADALETAAAWHAALINKQPCCLLLTRQKVPTLSQYKAQVITGVAKGAYKVNTVAKADITILATGSEVSLALKGAALLSEQGINAQVVSMPCWEYFDRQPQSYKEEIIPSNIPVMSVEAGSTSGWAKYTGNHEHVIGLDDFGISGPGGKVYEQLGFTAQAVADMAVKILQK